MGALYPLNSLDLPTYLVLLVLAIAVVGGWNRRTLEKVAVVAVASLVAWLPFTLRFVSFAGAIPASYRPGCRTCPCCHAAHHHRLLQA